MCTALLGRVGMEEIEKKLLELGYPSSLTRSVLPVRSASFLFLNTSSRVCFAHARRQQIII